MPRRDSESKINPTRTPRPQVFVKRECKFCQDQIVVDFTQTDLLRKYVTESGRILPRRYTGNCAYHQRELTRAIKHARIMQLVA